jgi:hypothetical protein
MLSPNRAAISATSHPAAICVADGRYAIAWSNDCHSALKRCGASHVGASNDQRPRGGTGALTSHWTRGTLALRNGVLRGARRHLWRMSCAPPRKLCGGACRT